MPSSATTRLALRYVASCSGPSSQTRELTRLSPPQCPDNASAVCGAGKCACQCNSGYYAGPNDVCLPASLCPAPNTVDPTTNTCSCVSPYQSNGSGGCVLAGSQRARSRRHRQQRRDFGKGHGAGQQVYAPVSSEGGNASQMSCPRGETACPLASGTSLIRSSFFSQDLE